MTKSNILKQTDGLFQRTFDRIAEEYPELESEHLIIDIGTAFIATHPDWFDVIVTPNLPGDIISDVASQIAGSVGLGGSANIGPEVAMFEAVHGSAPNIAGLGIANPSGLLSAAIQMLVHIGQQDVADRISNALLVTLEDGIHTGDLYQEGVSTEKVGTAAFAEAVIERLGQTPKQLEPIKLASVPYEIAAGANDVERELVGVDVFLCWDKQDRDPSALGEALREVRGFDHALALKVVTNRGVVVHPNGAAETFCTDHWGVRFVRPDDAVEVRQYDVFALLAALGNHGFEVVKMEMLYKLDGRRGYSLAHGEGE